MLKIGCHISIAKGFAQAGKDAVRIGANTFQYFTRNPRGGNAKELNEKDIGELKKIFIEEKFSPLFAHAPYTMNLCSDKENIRTFATNIFADDLERIKRLPESYYIFHPGSHVGQGIERGIEYIVDSMNQVIHGENVPWILLEGMSGKGTEVGGNFLELKKIIDGVKNNKKIGVCLDTCHLYSAGFDIKDNLEEVIQEFHEIIGLGRLKAIHLNDSKVPFGSKKDRHEVLGEGTLGLETIVKIINHELLKDLVFNLETPNELEGYEREIKLLRKRTLD